MARNPKSKLDLKYVKSSEITKIIDENYQDVWGIVKKLQLLLKTNGHEVSQYLISKYVKQKGLMVRGGKNSLMVRDWHPREIEILERYCGLLPFPEIVKKLNGYCLEKNLSFRTVNAIHAQIVKLGLSRDVADQYVSVRQIEKILNVSYDKVQSWLKIKRWKNILNPVENGNRIIIHRNNFKKFIVENRSEITQKCKPDWEIILELFEDS
ncbi:hypothetical protein NIES2100_05360 [Calothrix sp. NIES-2100]|uniref:hypothetical protein n=1 Tax=Calothrix sp. NIES-2100 TaxID=1954172 RepID=UPI000B608361|nr:hypothetical protein NIES2100_05360 [Calothrix sp. NIES-2100]